MHSELKDRIAHQKKRRIRVRRRLKGTAQKPRMSVYKSHSHLFVQVIDDEKGVTLAGIGSYDKAIKSMRSGKTKKEIAAIVGEKIAAKIKEHNVETVVFDRGSYKFHGVVAALAEAVREAGIKL